ncbi:PEP-CTERM protein-sorting domain-containing protein [Duganella sp. CF458]|uniref:PEP-CTERM sorting domain-containing protein n=1 Tax=Duganella sp. CF458 TaxID=1884368 RepID=UPI0008EA6E13|nr:PEP-CTERM sorting domain-containing protein [Duganella sp. CF458]SFF52380.1 PEP-CTERM protein-sorting domain-containing protein [Duganella sp. CF458]
MKSLVLPAILLASTGLAHAGIATTFNVDSGKHWSVKDDVLSYDTQIFTPFGGTLRSNLTSQRDCRNRYVGTAHSSTCFFDFDQSGIKSPFDNGYLARFESAEPPDQVLYANIQVALDGSYTGHFIFAVEKNEYNWNDSTSLFYSASYQLLFKGTGMDWATSIDAALAETLWHRESLSEVTFGTVWSRVRNDWSTGAETWLEWEGWESDLKVAAVPEPATAALFGIGLAAIAGLRRRKRN